MPRTAPPPPADIDPLSRIVRRYEATVWRFLRSLGASRAAAEELAVETFYVAYCRGFEARTPAETATYLRRTARNLWLNHRDQRSRDARRFSECVENIWAQSQDSSGGAHVQALRECIAGLQNRAAEAIQMCYGQGIEQKTAATQLGMKPNGLKTLLQRTRAALRSCVERKTK